MPVYAWDHAAAGEQRKLVKRSGLILKTQSTQKAARDFRQWLKKNKIDPGKGF